MARLGIITGLTDYSMQPAELALAIEERGLDSLYAPEHTHIPASRKTPWPGGDELPRVYSHTHDPFVALGAAAAVTERIRLGTGICLVVERDPIQLAKEVASLDFISDGRVAFGIGAGWNREEMANHGAQFEVRWKLVREKVLAMKAIWTEEQAEFHGEHVDFEPIWSWPKPVQSGGPPVLLGAQSRWAFDRVMEYCDGWLPLAPIGGLKESMAALRAAAERAERDFDQLEKTLFDVPPDPSVCEQYLELGFKELLFVLPSEPRDKALPVLDEYAAVAQALR